MVNTKTNAKSLERTSITASDIAVVEAINKTDSFIVSQLDQIYPIKNYLLDNGMTLHPLLIILGVSKIYAISIKDMLGQGPKILKARKARKTAIFMIGQESDGFISNRDIAKIFDIELESVYREKQYGRERYREDLCGFRGEIKQIRGAMKKL